MSNKKPGLRARRSISVVLVVLLMLNLAACGGESGEALRATESLQVATELIETAYGTLAFPAELFENLRHMEVTDGRIAMEVFYMVTEDGEKELYRIYYADAQQGSLVGYLETESGEIPVSQSMCEYAEEAFKNEEERQLYHSMMGAFSIIMNSLYADQRFSETKHIAAVENREVKLKYWNVTLPGNVSYEETVEGDTYRVDFYGEVSGERIYLYTVGIGDVQGETVLGQYTVKGVQKPIVVQTADMGVYESWPEEEQAVIYNMMSSLNMVIQTIVADGNFSDAEPAA